MVDRKGGFKRKRRQLTFQIPCHLYYILADSSLSKCYFIWTAVSGAPPELCKALTNRYLWSGVTCSLHVYQLTALEMVLPRCSNGHSRSLMDNTRPIIIIKVAQLFAYETENSMFLNIIQLTSKIKDCLSRVRDSVVAQFLGTSSTLEHCYSSQDMTTQFAAHLYK